MGKALIWSRSKMGQFHCLLSTTVRGLNVKSRFCHNSATESLLLAFLSRLRRAIYIRSSPQ